MSLQTKTSSVKTPVKLSVVVPLYNEEDNAAETVRCISEVIEPLNISWELILVDDGSTDNTLKVIEELAQRFSYIRFTSYVPNRGRGRALRTGFSLTCGNYVITTDADLSYDPAYMVSMIQILDRAEADVVLASPYTTGGGTQGVPLFRLLISRLGNLFLGLTLPKKVSTTTCIFRAYRREVLDTMEMESDGKEIHLEILSKAIAVGREIKEIPAVLTSRKKGKSKFRFGHTALSHLAFSFLERPILFFGLLGLAMILGGLAISVYIFYLYLEARLNPTRPFMYLIIILTLSGLFMFCFGLVAVKISQIRKEIYRIQMENLELKRWFKEFLSSSNTSRE